MAESVEKKHVNPPNTSTATRVDPLESGVMKAITSDGAWYQVRAINTTVSGDCFAFLLDDSGYLATTMTQAGTYVRAVTPIMWFPKGKVFHARFSGTDTANCGLFRYSEC